MGFLDNIKDAVQGRRHGQDARDDYYDDDYDDGYDDYDGGRYGSSPRDDDVPRSGLLGNPSRPEADSVSVYTRSGRQLSSDDYAPSAGSYRDGAGFRDDGAYRVADDSWRADADRVVPIATDPDPLDEPVGSYVPTMTQPGVFGATGNTPADVGLTAHTRSGSGKLPPYVLKPTSYDDVQMVIRRVRTNQPVVLSFKSLNIDTAKRILDFCFGLACGIDGSVEELGDRVFVVLPQGVELSDADVAKLRSSGALR